MELTTKQKQALADRRANDPLYWEQVRDHAQPVPLTAQRQASYENIYAQALDRRGVPRKPTLNDPAAKPLAMPAPSQEGPYRQAVAAQPMARVSDLPDKTALTVRPAIAIRPGMYQADDGTLRTIPFKQQPIGPVKGYPESGGNQWRANNDDDIVGAINSHHAKHGFLPGDEQFMTPGLMKSWQMQESGSTLHRKAFESDPFTVNSPADWKNTARDKERYGLRHRQAMTPATSAAAALEWMLHQGVQRGLLSGQRDALQFYNTRKDPTYKYADDVLNRYRNSYEDNL